MPGRDGVESSGAPATSLQSPVEITFGEYYYGHDCGVPYERNDHWLGFFGRIAERIVTELRPTSVLDAGCAMGMLVEALHARGVDAWGIDISEYAIGKVAPEVADRCRVGSLTDPLEGRFDLTTCIEVLEHMPSDDSYVALKNLCHASDRILFSSSPNDYAEPSHVNVRPPEWWSAQFAALGFLRNIDYDASYVAPWTVLYEHHEELRLTDVVISYDRAHWRLRDEVFQLRQAVLTLQQRLEEMCAGGGSGQAELDDVREELLAARDYALHLEIQLGEALGDRTRLEDLVEPTAQRLQEVLGSRSWRLGRKMTAPYRKLRAFLRGEIRSLLTELQR
jgi:SAM-dependent methyltransferase